MVHFIKLIIMRLCLLEWPLQFVIQSFLPVHVYPARTRSNIGTLSDWSIAVERSFNFGNGIELVYGHSIQALQCDGVLMTQARLLVKVLIHHLWNVVSWIKPPVNPTCWAHLYTVAAQNGLDMVDIYPTISDHSQNNIYYGGI